MRRFGHIISVGASALAILALGFVVSMAADSVPGRGAEEPLLDVAWRAGIDLAPVLTWLILIAAVMGAIILAFSAREQGPQREQKRRGIMALVLGLILFALVARYMRSIADTLLPETSEVIEVVGEESVVESTDNWTWLFGLLVAAIVAAALVRVGLTIRPGAAPFRDVAGDADDPTPVEVTPAVSLPIRGADPRGRIFDAYADFEECIEDAGVPRGSSETAARHSGRARTALGLNGEDLRLLSACHANARFGSDEPSLNEAMEAESASTRLRKDIPG